jgi:adenylate cyclase
VKLRTSAVERLGGEVGTKIAVRYALSLASSHVLAVALAVAIVIPLRWQLTDRAISPTAHLVTIAAILIGGGTLFVAVYGVRIIAGPLAWFVPKREPDRAQRRAAIRLAVRQSMMLAVAWAASGIAFVLANLGQGSAVVVTTLLGGVMGGAAAATTSLLLTQSTIRPIMIAAGRGSDGAVTVPGVQTRLILLWLLSSAIPFGTIAALLGLRSNGVIVPQSASVEIPILIVTLAALLVGLPAMILTSRSISEPLNEVADAMAKVQHGLTTEPVGVYERSEIGRLQLGFNDMVNGLAERDRVRDVFGRHVGFDVARRAIDEGVTLSGDVQEVAVLFIDLVGSTAIAANSLPREVAELLNRFFKIVVHAVDLHDGVINKFQGDAALAVFGAPLRTKDAASQALSTARTLQQDLRRVPAVDFGIGLSAGAVFAGNIGAEDRYEYTVIGDPVNEAARLAELAKTHPQRILCSSAVVDRSDDAERRHWVMGDCVVLRGRSDSTDVYTPAESQRQAT